MKIKVDDLVIVGNLGELKIYKANPRDLEAEAGLKPENVKLDLLNSCDYIEGHQKIKDIVTDEAGRFKADAGKMGGSIAPENHLEEKLEEDVIKQIAADIDSVAKDTKAHIFLSLPETIFNRVYEKIENKNKIVQVLKEDLVKTDKSKLLDFFNEKGQKL